MVNRRHTCATLVLLVAGLLGARAFAADEAPVFRFNPPAKTVRMETTKTTQLLTVQGREAPSRGSELSERVELVRVPDGYRLSSKLLTASTQGGRASEQALLDALKGATLVYMIDPQGQVQSVQGAEAVSARVKKGVTPEVAQMLSRALAPDALVKGLKAEWDRRVGDLVGRPASVGTVWVSRQRQLSPDGSLTDLHVATRVAGTAKMQGHDCLRVENVFSSDPESLRSFLGADADALLAGLKPLGGTSQVTGESQWITDPATLLWYQGSAKLTMVTTMEVPGKGAVPVTVTWIKQYRTKPSAK